MSWINRLIRTFHPDPLDTALDDELRFHLSSAPMSSLPAA
jgi:hypothetical protein